MKCDTSCISSFNQNFFINARFCTTERISQNCYIHVNVLNNVFGLEANCLMGSKNFGYPDEAISKQQIQTTTLLFTFATFTNNKASFSVYTYPSKKLDLC